MAKEKVAVSRLGEIDDVVSAVTYLERAVLPT